MTAKDEQLRWELTQHCCRCCFGRVVMRITFDRRRVYRCTCCGVEAEGHQPSAICACGIKLGKSKDAGIRCVVNTRRTPENMSEIVAEQVDVSNLVTR
jgi:hypothetical protein